MNELYEINNRIKNKGYKITNQRELILDIFYSNRDYLLSASEVFEKAIKKDKNINFSTIYRNLELFVNIEVVKKFSMEGGKNNYQLITDDKHQHSLICKTCGRTSKIHNCPFEKIDKEIFALSGFLPETHKFEVYGYCKNCLKKSE